MRRSIDATRTSEVTRGSLSTFSLKRFKTSRRSRYKRPPARQPRAGTSVRPSRAFRLHKRRVYWLPMSWAATQGAPVMVLQFFAPFCLLAATRAPSVEMSAEESFSTSTTGRGS